MPIGPNNISTVRHDLIQRTCYEIDAILQDPSKSRNVVTGDSVDYYYSFVFPGHLSELEKLELTNLYLNVGWGRVKFTNSSELNQRAGQFLVKLYLKADSMYLR